MEREDLHDCFAGRLRLAAALIACLMTILPVRLWMVQLREGERHSRALADQSVRRIRMAPVRGRMLASDGQTILVDTLPSYDLVFHLAEMRQPGSWERTEEHILDQASAFARLIGRAMPFARDRVHRHQRVYPALPLVVFRDLSSGELAKVGERVVYVKGASVRVSKKRTYPFRGLGSHVLGFTGRRQPERFERRKYAYTRPELSGRAGLELQYDDKLSGTAGAKLVRVDTLGFVHETVGDIVDPEHGFDLVLTLDARAQEAADAVLRGHAGALVCVDATDGAVLAMASSPSYDLAELRAGRYAELAADENRRPLVNRAVAGGYLPGSIVKPLVALAALDAGVADPTDRVTCPGYARIGNGRIGCWYQAGHGSLAVREALEGSCNVYFIEMGMRTGLDRIRPMFLAAGLGTAPTLDLPGVGTGLVPSRSWARGHWGRGWLAIDTAYLSIGQGAVNLSPLQAALYTAAIGNGGTVYRPYLVREVRNRNGRALQRVVPHPERRLPVTPEVLTVVQEGMVAVVDGANGSARRVRTELVSLAGKTGTAEVKTPREEYNNTWFVCYGPATEPRFAVALVIERGQSGGRTAAPLVRKFLEQWLAE